MVQASECFNEDVSPFVAELVTTSDEEVQSLVEIEVKMPVKVTASELVELFLGHCVKILKLVQRRELLNIQSIWCDDVRLTLQKMLRFIAGNFGDCCEDMREVGSCAFETVTEGESDAG